LALVLVCCTRAASIDDAQKELFAARYKSAAESYAKILESDPTQCSAYDGLVRSLIEDHRSKEAYAAASEGLQKCPQSPAAHTAAGMAAYRKAELSKAEGYFRDAIKLDSGYPGALRGLASLNAMVSRFKAARGLLLAAYRKSPGDPDLIIAHANTLKGEEHIAALRVALAILDPESEEARRLRAHIANDVAVGDRKLRRLTSPYAEATIKLSAIREGPSDVRGVGLHVQLNERQTVTLLLDTGASGISVSPKAASRAGLDVLGSESGEAKGIGDRAAQPSYEYLASQVRVGDVTFSNYPVAVFKSAKSQDFDGLIGADVFSLFLVKIDFPKLRLFLEPRAVDPRTLPNEPTDAPATPAAGFHRAFRFGNHLAVTTFINGGEPSLFLIDSGSTYNLVDTATAHEYSKVDRAGNLTVQGIQGKVDQTSMADRVSLVFAGFRQENPKLIAISLEKTSDGMGVALGGILGWQVLGQLAVTIDYHEGTVRLEHAE
jgi:hypothetical protein